MSHKFKSLSRRLGSLTHVTAQQQHAAAKRHAQRQAHSIVRQQLVCLNMVTGC